MSTPHDENNFPLPDELNEYPNGAGESPETDPNADYKPKGFTAWIIGGLVSGLVAVAIAYNSGQNETNSTWKTLYNEEREQNRINATRYEERVSALYAELDTCSENALDDLERQLQKAQRLQASALLNERKIDQQINITKKNTEVLQRASKKLENELKK